MPITRKLTTVGAARGITLPRSWIESHERAVGAKITEIEMEVNGVITLRPVFEKKNLEDSRE